jgi:hypothetical protein
MGGRFATGWAEALVATARKIGIGKELFWHSFVMCVNIMHAFPWQDAGSND